LQRGHLPTTAHPVPTAFSFLPPRSDGADYWSPQCDRGGSLPFQLIAVVQNLLDVNLPGMAADRLGWWLDNYLKENGEISTCDWG